MIRSKPYLALIAVAVLLVAAACQADSTLSRPAGKRAFLTNQPPVAVANLTTLGAAFCPGPCYFNYEFDAYQSYDPDGSIASYRWVLHDGSTASYGSTWSFTALRAYETCTGNKQGKLIVTDNAGAADTTCFGYTDLQ